MNLAFNTRPFHVLYWPDLDYVKIETEAGLRALKTLDIIQEEGLIELVKKFEQYLSQNELYKSLDEEGKASYSYQLYGAEEQVIEELERQQRYSICLSAFAFFEGRLHDICKLISMEFAFKIKPDDLVTREYISGGLKYIEKVFEADLAATQPYFTPIKHNKEVRNKIAHRQGWTSDDKLSKTLSGIEGFRQPKYGSEYRITLFRSYMPYLFDKMDHYFRELIVAVDLRYKELKNLPELKTLDLEL